MKWLLISCFAVINAQLNTIISSIEGAQKLPFVLADIQWFPSLTIECGTTNLPEISTIDELIAQRGKYLCYWAAGRVPNKPFNGSGMMYILEMSNQAGIVSTFYNSFMRNKVQFTSRCRNPLISTQPDRDINLGLVFQMGKPGFWYKPQIGKINHFKTLREEEFDDGRDSLLYFYDVDWSRECADETPNDNYPRGDFTQLNNDVPYSFFFESVRVIGQTNEDRKGDIYLIRVFLSEIGMSGKYGTVGYVAMIVYDESVSLLPLDMDTVQPTISTSHVGFNQLITIPGVISSLGSAPVSQTAQNIKNTAQLSTAIRPIYSIPPVSTILNPITNPVTQLILTPGSGGSLTGSATANIADAIGLSNLLRGSPINSQPIKGP